MAPIYRVTPVGEAYGQEIRMNFYYRLGAGIDAQLLPFLGSQAIAEEFMQEVVPVMMSCLSNGYFLRYVEVDVIESTFDFMLSMPYRMYANGERGGVSGESLGPASYVWLRASLEPMTIFEGIIAPKKGGVMFGPLSETMFEDGLLSDGWFNTGETAFAAMANKLAQDLQAIDPPALYYPVRVKMNRILGGLIDQVGYSDVQTFTVDPRLKTLKSRQREI